MLSHPTPHEREPPLVCVSWGDPEASSAPRFRFATGHWRRRGHLPQPFPLQCEGRGFADCCGGGVVAHPESQRGRPHLQLLNVSFVISKSFLRGEMRPQLEGGNIVSPFEQHRSNHTPTPHVILQSERLAPPNPRGHAVPRESSSSAS